jgi:hypothetical protein
MKNPPGKHAAKLHELFRENGWTEDTRLFRGSLPEFLSPNASPAAARGSLRISANRDPSESVIDIYGQGHTCLARDVGAGLAFVETNEHEWRGSSRKPVSVRLGDVVAQGGRVYPVASVVTDRTWYVTLPAGGIDVREA